jgi:hypothetical protein
MNCLRCGHDRDAHFKEGCQSLNCILGEREGFPYTDCRCKGFLKLGFFKRMLWRILPFLFTLGGCRSMDGPDLYLYVTPQGYHLFSETILSMSWEEVSDAFELEADYFFQVKHPELSRSEALSYSYVIVEGWAFYAPGTMTRVSGVQDVLSKTVMLALYSKNFKLPLVPATDHELEHIYFGGFH